jgi:hypothetical protein
LVVSAEERARLEEGADVLCGRCCWFGVLRGAGPFLWLSPAHRGLAKRMALPPGGLLGVPPPTLAAALTEAARPN